MVWITCTLFAELRNHGGVHPAAHFAFSKGAHFCLGAPIARMEAQVAVGEILRRFPNWRIAEPVSEIPWMNSMVARGPMRLPVTLA